MTRKHYLIFSILVVTVLHSCQLSSSIGRCISPAVAWEFPVMATVSVDAVSDLETKVLPSGSWILEATLPSHGHVINIVAHSPDQIWILMDNGLFRYNINTYTWNEISTIGDLTTYPQMLYQSRNGTLWGANLKVDGNHDAQRKIPLLVRYDDESGTFIFVQDRDNILNSDMDLIAMTEPIKYSDGKMWMLVEEEIDTYEVIHRLISFDPINLQAVRHFAQKVNLRVSRIPASRFVDIAIPMDGNIWISDIGLPTLHYYRPSIGELHTFYGNPGALDGFSSEDLRGYFGLYVDRDGRLWIDDRGWLDFSNPKNPIWHKVIRSPVFISDSVSPENQFGWGRPDRMYQSSNGMYWFSNANIGLVRLNPENGEWCNFTTGSSPIVEDSQGNLWIALFGKLYRYHLAP